MALLSTANLSPLKKVFAFAGIGLLALSMLLFVSILLGLADLETYAVFGQSGLRNLAGVAVAGCLLAAIGFLDE